MTMKSIALTTMAAILAFAAGAAAQQMPVPSGAPISVDNAKKAAAAAVAEARKNNWNMAIAVADAAGNLVYFETIDGTRTASGNIAIGKAHAAAIFKRPT